MAISLKEQLRLVKEVIYHAPVFNKDYYEDSDLHGAGQRSGTRMFYDFYAMELLWAMVGSGSRSRSEREKKKELAPGDPAADIVGTTGQPVRHILRHSETVRGYRGVLLTRTSRNSEDRRQAAGQEVCKG
jgi:hypothetical protein